MLDANQFNRFERRKQVTLIKSKQQQDANQQQQKINK